VDAFGAILRIVTILAAPVTFMALLVLEKCERGHSGGAVIYAILGLLLLVLGIAIGGVGGYFGGWGGTRQWKGFVAFLSFEPGTVGFFSDFIAVAYGFLAFSIFRAIFPSRKGKSR
jgi:hypothetical protein